MPRSRPVRTPAVAQSGPELLDQPVVRSPRNPRVKAAASLASRRARDAEGRYLVEGPRFVSELLSTGDVEEVFALPHFAADLTDAVERAAARLTLVEAPVLRRLADSVSPQGVVAVARQRRGQLADVVGGGFLIVLCGAADPGNVGSAIRTATAAGASGVVLTSGSVDPWNPKAVRSSAGSVARLPLVVDVEVDQLLAACRSVGQRFLALDPSATGSIEVSGILQPPVALLFGNEAHGLPQSVVGTVEAVSIPRYGPIESLNLGAAVAVAAYAAARAARTGPPPTSPGPAGTLRYPVR
ncbi:MAG: TrmH family RNA methyltransferase [Nitriliruptorales bacterium]